MFTLGDVSFKVDAMLSYFEGQDQDALNNDVNLAQFNIQAGGLFQDKDVVLWAGERYYQRHDVHIVDNYYWDVSGIGAGVEHLKIGPGKLSLALLQDTVTGDIADGQETTAVIADIRYSNIPLWHNADLELGIDINFANEKQGQTVAADDSVLLTISLNQGFSEGVNKTILQLANSGYAQQIIRYDTTGRGLVRDTNNNDAVGFRLINWGTFSIGEHIELGHTVRYTASTDVGTDNSDDRSVSLVLRPLYKWDQHRRTIIEIGGVVETINNQQSGGGKFTLAQAWVPQVGFWSRPEFRLFATYLSDFKNKNAFAEGQKDELSIGFQVEAWW